MNINFVSKTIWTLAIACVAHFAQAQSLTVIQVSGKIQLEGNQQLLKPGTSFKEADKIRFVEPKAQAVVLSSKKGRFVLRKDKNPAQPNGSSLGSALSYLFTSQDPNRMSGRSTANLNSSKDLSSYLGKGNFMVVGDSLELCLTPQLVAKVAKFNYNYTVNGEAKTVEAEADDDGCVFFPLPGLVDEHDNAYDITDGKLYAVDHAGKQSFIGPLNPRLIDEEDIQEQLTALFTFQLQKAPESNAVFLAKQACKMYAASYDAFDIKQLLPEINKALAMRKMRTVTLSQIANY